MTNVTIYQDKNQNVLGFDCVGHAGFARFGKDTTRISLRRGNTWIRVWTYAKSSVEDVRTSIKLIQNQYEIESRNIIIDAD